MAQSKQKETKMQAPLLNMKGESVGQVDLQDTLVEIKPSKEFLHEYVTVYLANQRERSASVKTRSEVSGGGKKPWKQKHTGRARAGSNRSPLWRHGGVIHGPKSGRIHLEFPRQKARKALAHALAAKYQEGKITFLDSVQVEDARTREIVAFLKKLNCSPRTVLVMEEKSPKVSLASRNIKEFVVTQPENLNAYRVLSAERLLLTKAAWQKLSVVGK